MGNARLGSRGGLLMIGGLLLLLALLPVSDMLGRSATETDPARRHEAPSLSHFFGTDSLGRDVLARTLSAARVDVALALGATLMAFFLGVVLGGTAGYVGGTTDAVIMRLLEMIQAIPGILLGLLIVVLAGSGFASLVVALTLINAPVYARLVRAEVQPLARSPLVAAARMSMISGPRTLGVYVLPAALTSALAYLPVQAGFSVSVAAGFGFLGVGIQPPQAEWGMMIRESLSELLFLNIWWPVLFPALFLTITVLVLYRLGDLLEGRQSG